MSKSTASGRKTSFVRRFRIMRVFMVLSALIISITPAGRRIFSQACYEFGFNDRRDETELLEIHILDVGKADAILIRSQDHAALIDAGKFDAADTVADYLLRHKVTALDYLIMSHPDSDHIGGMPGVLGEISVDAFVQADTGYFSEEGSGLSALLSMLEQNGTDTMSMEPGDSFTMGQAVFTAIGPMGSFEDPNNSSLVLRMDCRDFSALFCGDMEYDGEQALILSGQDIDIDLLKVGHHGSSTSSSLRFLWETSPKYAAISTALDRNLLPRDEVLERLEDIGAEIYRTDTDGNIVFIYDGGRVRVRLDKEERTDYETVEHRPF